MTEYELRQTAMEAWYEEYLDAGEARAEQGLLSDYSAHAEFLGTLRGRIVDVGGGAGIAARFMPHASEYVVVDPSRLWVTARWADFARKLRTSGPEPQFVHAAGEAIPIPDASFDSAICFWALNHARHPALCVAEIARVLRPGGLAYLVLEDMPPGWGELCRDAAARASARVAGKRFDAAIQMPLMQAVAAKLRNDWPLQSDHIRITDRDLRGWAKDTLSLRRRSLTGGYQTYLFARR